MDSVALTALMVTAARAREHERPDRLFWDPYAAALAGEEGFRLLVDLVRQPHLVMFKVLSLVVALFRSCLVGASPGGPVVGVVAWVGGVIQGGP